MDHPSIPLTWQRHPLTQLIALAVTVVPLYLITAWTGLNSAMTGAIDPPTIGLSVLNLALMVIWAIWVYVVLRYLLGESLTSLNLRPGTFLSDLALGFGLALTLLVLIYLLAIAQYVFISLAGSNAAQSALEPSQAMVVIAQALRDDPLLLAFWLGPVIWVQAALIEEFMRAFMLTRLWHVYSSTAGRLLSILAGALFFGMAHLYQESTGLLVTGLIGMLFGLHYLWHGRMLPLIIAHGLYNTAVLLAFLYAYPSLRTI